MNTISNRARHVLNLEQYAEINLPEDVKYVPINVPTEPQYVLRVMINRPLDPFNTVLERVPEDLQWTKNLIQESLEYQLNIVKMRHAFMYLTVRNGPVVSTTDDEWHVDGFSMRISHLPEQNYVWVKGETTECCSVCCQFPSDFDPLKHNIQTFFQDKFNPIEKKDKLPIRRIKSETITAMDPYITHRRPSITNPSKPRTFVRVSFVPIQIQDKNNTLNPLLHEKDQISTIDGVVDFRDKLLRYKIAA
jgi:hypothetical protein